MLCQVPEDYYLKQFSVSLTCSSSLWVVDEFIISGKSDLQITCDIVCNIEAVKPPVNWLNVAICDLQVHWLPSTTYKFRFSEDFYRELSDNQPNPQFDITYTTNPLPEIDSANPAFNDVNAVNNTTIQLNFDRKMRRGDAGNIYLYEVASPSDILLGTFDTESDVTLSENGASISFSTLGLMKANTEYYILTDERIYRDYDNFYLPQITDTNFYTFTTDQSEELFPDLITIQFVTGDVAVEYIRYRNQSSNFALVDSTLTNEYIRYRNQSSNFDLVDSSMVSATTYNTGKLKADLPVSLFDAFDIFTTYNTGTLRSNISADIDLDIPSYIRYRNNVSSIDSAVDLDSSVGVIKPLASSIDAMFNNTSVLDRFRRPATSINASFSAITRGGKWYDYLSYPYTNNLYRAYGTIVNGKDSKVIVATGPTTGGYYAYNTDILDLYSSNIASGVYNVRASNQYVLDTAGSTTGTLRSSSTLGSVRTFTAVSTWNFGHSIAVSDGYSVLTQFKAGNANKVFVYDNSTGSALWQISSPLGSGYWFGGARQDPSDFFKYIRNCLAVDSNYFVIGAPSDGVTSGTDGGRVYVHNVSTGSLVHTLINPNTGTNSQYDGFGLSVAIYGNYLVVGAPRTELSGSGLKNGCVYVYNLTTGALVTTLNNPTTTDNGWFGWSVDINNDFVIVGAPDHSSLRGTAYLYKISDWSRTTLQQLPFSQGINSRFGFSVCLNSTHAIVGSPGVNSSGVAILNGRIDAYALIQY